MQMRIQLAALAGMLVTGLVVALVTAWPTYLDSRAQIDTVTRYGMSALAQNISQIVASRHEVAGQIASRSQIRDVLAAYNDFRIGLTELASFSEPRLNDALGQVEGLVGLTRFDRDGHAVVQLGVMPRGVDVSQLDVLHDTARVSFVEGQTRQPYVQVVTPIMSRQGVRVGADAILFDMPRLGELLGEIELAGGSGEAWLRDVRGGNCIQSDETMQLRFRSDPAACDAPRANGRVAFQTPIGIGFADDEWELLVELDEDALYAPALSGLAMPLLSILLLVVLGALATSRAIRPFAQRLVRQTDELAEIGSEQQALLELASSFVFRADNQGRIVEVSSGAQRVTGWPPADLLPRLDAVLGQEIRAALRVGNAERERGAGSVSGPWSLTASDGRILQFELSSQALNRNEGVHGLSGVLRDVTERERYQDRIRHLAHYDALTGLPNRALALDRLEHAIDRARRGNGVVGVLFVDLDRFKSVNDNLGHGVGDRLLQCVARRFEAVVREEDTLARLGGDEFLVVLEDVWRADDVARVAEKLLASLLEPVRVGAYELQVGASIGICLFPEDGETPDELIRCADSAMYRAKAAGRDTFAYFTAELAASTRDRFELERGLRQALVRGEFHLVYQAQADCRTGGIVGAEALLRWQREDGTMVPPDVFIPVAEELGMMHELGAWVLGEACAEARRWHDAGHPLRLAVNLSIQQLGRDDLAEVVKTALEASGLPATALELEITEGHVMHDVTRCIALLNALRSLGTCLAIDDFGTGYSSLAYLKRLPIDRLKIDRSFVEGLPADDDDVAIVATVVAMARHLALEVVAEGVETEAQRDHLARAGCAAYQGYLLARPEPGAALIARLTQQACEQG